MSDTYKNKKQLLLSWFMYKKTILHGMSNISYFYTCPVCLQITTLCVFTTNAVIVEIYAYNI